MTGGLHVPPSSYPATGVILPSHCLLYIGAQELGWQNRDVLEVWGHLKGNWGLNTEWGFTKYRLASPWWEGREGGSANMGDFRWLQRVASLQPNWKCAHGQRQVTTSVSCVHPEAAQSLQLCTTVTDPEHDACEHGLARPTRCVDTLYIEMPVGTSRRGSLCSLMAALQPTKGQKGRGRKHCSQTRTSLYWHCRLL